MLNNSPQLSIKCRSKIMELVTKKHFFDYHINIDFSNDNNNSFYLHFIKKSSSDSLKIYYTEIKNSFGVYQYYLKIDKIQNSFTGEDFENFKTINDLFITLYSGRLPLYINSNTTQAVDWSFIEKIINSYEIQF